MRYTVNRDEEGNFYVYDLKEKKEISPLFPTERQAWAWFDKQDIKL